MSNKTMNIGYKSLPSSLLSLAVVFLIAGRCLASPPDLTGYVNPFIGTSPTLVGGEVHRPFPFNTGNVFPGAVCPVGMVQFSPDTPSNQAGGYWYPDKEIKAFSLTHFSGRGIPYEGDVGFLPVAGTMTATTSFSFRRYQASFSHVNEKASPGYYSVKLDDGNLVELTTTPRTGTMRVTFPPGTQRGTILLNNGNSVRGVADAQSAIVNGDEIDGFVDSYVSTGPKYRVYYSALFDRPFTDCGTWNGGNLTPGVLLTSGASSGAYVSFNTSGGAPLLINVGISYVSLNNAKLNRAKENGTFDFDAVRSSASSSWNSKLRQILIRDPQATPDSLTVFYTELYRTMIHPNIFDDVDGQYLGLDQQVHTEAPGHHHYTHIEGWGGYRTAAPFLAFLEPDTYSDIAQSMVDDAALDNGCVSRWLQQEYDTKGNIGDGGVNILADAYAFGARNFDTLSALKYMDENASAANGYREHGDQFDALGWVAGDNGMTVEYAITDLALAEFARANGRQDLYQKYLLLSQNWRNIFNPATLSIEGKDAQGNWERGYSYEGSDAQYNWLVPQDVRGLFDAMGGNDKVIPRLDAFFGWDPATKEYIELNAGYGGTSGSGFGGDSLYNYAGDETCEVHPWLYLYAGVPWKTEKVVRDIETSLYLNTPDGMPGNDDGGELSSWYVFAALGIYPNIAGVGGFSIGSPLFADTTLTTEAGHILHIVGKDASPGNPYVQSLKLNGSQTQSLWLPVDQILTRRLTTLEFSLGPQPKALWASAPQDSPPSFDPSAK